MNIIELSKNYCTNFYAGDYQQMIKEKDGVIYNDDRIKAFHNNDKGTEKDFRNYMNNNRKFCKYYDLNNNKFI